MGGESTEFLKKITEEFHSLNGIILSDSDGILICQSVPAKDNQKFVQATSMLISAINQAQSNLQKVLLAEIDQDILVSTGKNLIHIAHHKNLMVTLFMQANSNIQLAKEISSEVASAFDKLNSKIPEIRSHCH